MRSLLLSAGTVLLLCGSSAQAEEPQLREYQAPDVTVVGVRPVTTVGGASAVEVMTDSLRLSPAPTVEEVFRRLPLLHVRTNSRGEAEISARGSESRQVAVLVDGVPLTLAWDARMDASVIPATAPQELSYVRGLSSMLHGPNVLGGVIEMNVGRALAQPERSSYDVRTGVDDVGAWGGTARVTAPFRSRGGRWLLRAGAGLRDSPGQPLAHGVDERVKTEDGLRLNTDSRTTDGFVSLRHATDAGAWASFSAASFRGERGIAAELGVPDDDARFWRYPHVWRTLAVLSAGSGDRTSPLGGYGDMEMSVGFDRGRSEIDAYTSSDYRELDSFENGDDRTITTRLLADQSIGSRGSLAGALTFAEIRHDEELPDGDARYRQRLWSAGAEGDLRLVESGTRLSTLRISAGAAWDVAVTPEAGGKEALGRLGAWGGRLGLSAGLGAGDTRLHAGMSRRSRFPALRELYSGALNRFAPNPDLEPERLTTFEAGVTTRFGRGEAQAVVFHNELRDAVVRIRLPDPDSRFMRVNRDELVSTGLELLLSQERGRLSFTGNLTVQSVDLTDTDAGETNRPENLPEVFGDAALRARLGRGFTGGVEARYTGEQFTIDPETGGDKKLEGKTRIDLEVARAWSSRLQTTVAMENVTDIAVYDLVGLPEPGRSVRFQVRFSGN